ncbi:hypothetical protein OC844_001953 [Tilletia horrida]|nr:hypothetical protein OC844_001953 [Tilletia horrida]
MRTLSIPSLLSPYFEFPVPMPVNFAGGDAGIDDAYITTNAAASLVVFDGKQQAVVTPADYVNAQVAGPGAPINTITGTKTDLDDSVAAPSSDEEDADISMDTLVDNESDQDDKPQATIFFRRVWVLSARKPGFKLVASQPAAVTMGLNLCFFIKLIQKSGLGILRIHLCSDITAYFKKSEDPVERQQIQEFITHFGKKFTADEVVFRLTRWIHLGSALRLAPRAKEAQAHLFLPEPDTPYYDKEQDGRRYLCRYKREVTA